MTAHKRARSAADPGGCFAVQGAMTCFNMSRQVKEHIGDMHVTLERLIAQPGMILE
jgi:hypothetical protein